MGQEHVVKAFNEVYKKGAHNIPQLIGLSNTSNIVDVTFRTAECVPQFVLGIKEGLKPYVDKGEIPVNVLVNILAIVTAGFAKEVDEVNQ